MMTNEQEKSLKQVWTKNANKQNDFVTVINTTAKALCTDTLTSAWVKRIVGEYGSEERKHFNEIVALMMPHYVLNGTAKVVACDFVTATDENKLSKTIKQYRLSVDDEIVKPEGCLTYIDTKREQDKKQKFTLKFDTGYTEEIERTVKDADGNVVKETVAVQLVPRKKAAWGYTQDVYVAVRNAINYIDDEK